MYCVLMAVDSFEPTLVRLIAKFLPEPAYANYTQKHISVKFETILMTFAQANGFE